MKNMPVTVDFHDVFVARNGPIRTKLGVFAVMDGIFVPKPVEERHFLVFNPQTALGNIDIFQSQIFWIKIGHVDGWGFTH